jgi:ribonuclease Z
MYKIKVLIYIFNIFVQLFLNKFINMSISYQVLGNPGKDNALFVIINSGTKYYRILFDCGEGLLDSIKQSDLKNIDYLFLSHLHIDHVAGFDYFFRRNFDRDKPVFIFGPEQTINIIHNRLQGYIWNWVEDLPGEFYVTEISENKTYPPDRQTKQSVFFTKEGFEKDHTVDVSNELKDKMPLVDNDDFAVTSVILNHSIPSLAYKLIEKQRMEIKADRLSELNLHPGPWLEEVRNFKHKEEDNITIDGKSFKFKFLREKLLEPKEFDSIVYLTDFIFDEKAKTEAVKIMEGCKVAVCESQYQSKDEVLAKKNFHLTSLQAALLARDANIGKLILFHISDRYRLEIDYKNILAEAREIFPNTFFPEEWELESDL